MLRGRERVGSRVKDWLNNLGTYDPTAWVRPADWLPMPAVGDNTFKGLYAIYDTDTNFCTFKLTTSAGAYTIDWGDGVTKADCVSGTTYEHVYDRGVYAALGAGTYCSRGYKQVIVTVTPNAGNITAIDLSIRYSLENQVYSTQWLDISWSAAACTSFTTYLATTGQNASMLEQCTIGALSASYTNFTSMFQNCYSLQSVPLFNTAAGTNFSSMFSNCFFLQSVPLFNTGAGTNFSNMFQSCSSLQSVPLFNTAVGTIFSGMFNGCYSLQSVPLFNTAAGTNFASMFSNCYSLQSVPLFNTGAGTNFSNMFQYCSSLQSVPLFNTGAGTNFSNMFQYCYSLQSVPLLSTQGATILTTMLLTCRSLQKATLSGTKAHISYLDCRLASDDIVDIFGVESTREILTINVSPLTSWAAGDVITGQTSTKTCTVVSKVDDTHYIVTARSVGAWTDGEQIGVTGTAAKLADQNVGAPTFTSYGLYDFREIITLNVSPVTDWEVNDVITGQTSAKTCTVVSKIDATHYIVKSRVAGSYTDGEQIGVTGNADKLADQNPGAPAFADIEMLQLDVAPSTAWSAGGIVIGTTSFVSCVIVEKFSNLLYSIKNRSGSFTVNEILTTRETMTLDTAPGGAGWSAGNTIIGDSSGKTCVIISKTSGTVYIVNARTGVFTPGEILSNGTDAADQVGAYPTFAIIATNSADQGAANPLLLGRTPAAGSAKPVITITGNWGAAGASTLSAVNKGWTVTA